MTSAVSGQMSHQLDLQVVELEPMGTQWTGTISGPDSASGSA